MVELTLPCASYLSEYILHRVFSDVFVPHSVPVTLGTSDDDLPTREFIVEDVRVNFFNNPITELTVFSHRFLTRRNPSGSIVARLRTLPLATVARAWFSQ